MMAVACYRVVWVGCQCMIAAIAYADPFCHAVSFGSILCSDYYIYWDCPPNYNPGSGWDYANFVEEWGNGYH